MMAVVDVSWSTRIPPNNSDDMPMAPLNESACKRARVSRGPIVLAAIINGASLTEIAKSENIFMERVERLMREELHGRWIRGR